GFMRPMALWVYSVNQRLPSGPAAMPAGVAPNGGQLDGVQMPLVISVTTPATVTCAILLPRSSVNHRLPSDHAVMKVGSAKSLMPKLYSVTTPSVVICATWLMPKLMLCSVNQRLPSGPAAIAKGRAPGV